MEHITVLKAESVDALAVKKGSVVVDATLGAAGHAEALLARLGTKGTFVGIDADHTAIEAASRLTAYDAHVHLVEGNFRDIDTLLHRLTLTTADAILADLGWRMEQFSGSGKGFSFLHDEPLAMTYGDSTTYAFTASDIVNEWDAKDIENVIRGYGEERYARRIAERIVTERAQHPIESTLQLADIITAAVPGQYRHGPVHPATKTFQALRIAVNDELDTLRMFIEKAIALLAPEGRLAIITFHSLEDRIVKHSFREYAARGEGEILTKKPTLPTREEVATNRRARSAKLRVFKKVLHS
ncbi:16S rRNA (cytosine(1402)-N(4))-methyltransferase RsmH [Candidatus Kaiserbacteria bacterium]|nr:16S rRNA (cytosine(1402)-N(4))-methyltransferase RsmH [Candidatus Kaiserbacteria bacterium]